MDKTKFKPYPDGGSLRANKIKKSPMSADYWGEIAIKLSDMTNIHTEDGLTVVKLSGWKKVDSQGNTYLSLAVNRFVPEAQGYSGQRKQSSSVSDDEVPF
jgi:hypothetical protein